VRYIGLRCGKKLLITVSGLRVSQQDMYSISSISRHGSSSTNVDKYFLFGDCLCMYVCVYLCSVDILLIVISVVHLR